MAVVKAIVEIDVGKSLIDFSEEEVQLIKEEIEKSLGERLSKWKVKSVKIECAK